MKWLFIALPSILIILLLGSSELSSNTNLNVEQRESYEACVKIKRKAPFFNLNCEHLLGNLPNIKNDVFKTDIKTLPTYESATRRVNGFEELKLKNFIKRLSKQNKKN